MHIGIITSEFPPDFGGVETYAEEYAKALVNMGHKVTVLVPVGHSPYTLSNIAIFPVLKCTRYLDREILMHYDVDAWHCMNAAHSILAATTGKPFVVSIHGNDFLNPYPLTARPPFSSFGPLWRLSLYLRPIELWLGKWLTPLQMHKALPKAEIIISNSQYTKDVFLKKFPECKDITLVAQVGVGESFLEQDITKSNNINPQLLTVSRLSEPRKNVDKVIEALYLLKDEYDFHYTVIGDGSYKPTLQNLVHKLGMSDKVSFVGRQTMEEVISAMKKADLFILTSSILENSHEGFGIVYLEAAACGTPSLATRQAGALEAIEDGVSGYFVEEATIENIRIALEKSLNGRIHFDTAKCRTFAEKFTWHRVVQNALPYYLSRKY